MPDRTSAGARRRPKKLLDRRLFLAGGGGLLAASAVASPMVGRVRAAEDGVPLWGGLYPFTLGVASGDPLAHRVVIWTRLAPMPEEPDGGLPRRWQWVFWEVAEDEWFNKRVRRGYALANPRHGHSVHVDVAGLKPGRDYWYRFRSGGELSPVGRTRTAPGHRQSPDQVRYVFASCQDYEDGFFTAYDHMAAEPDVDVALFLGDYIYEGRPKPVGGDVVRSHSGEGETITLEDYRVRYALYKTDPLLQKAHAAMPWIVTLDDHEVDNDWSADIPQDPEVQPREAFLARRAAAFQAYWEHMPMRLRNRPVGSDMRIYRRFTYGDLIEFNVLDTRQFRSVSEPCGYGTGPICEEVLDPTRTMLGDRQERWLLRGLDRSRARWNVLAQQVPVTQLDVGESQPEFKLDKWDAYPVARQRILDFLAERRPSNPLVVTGDLHDNWVALLKSDFADPDSETLATEFIGTSISSDGDGAERSEEGEIALAKNPHLLFHNYRRGYVRATVTKDHLTKDFRTVPFVQQPGAEISTRTTFVLEDGDPVAKEI